MWKRKYQVEQHKCDTNKRQQHGCERRGELDGALMLEVAVREFKKPFSNNINNAIHRKLFDEILSMVLALQKPPLTTKISRTSMDYAVAYVIANSHNCLDKLRNTIVYHQKLKNLPMLLRYSTVHALYSCYCGSLKNQQAIGNT